MRLLCDIDGSITTMEFHHETHESFQFGERPKGINRNHDACLCSVIAISRS